MAPIYDTDIAQQRWAQTEWQNIELWEQVQRRERRKKLLWIGFAIFLFVSFSSITIIQERYWKWKSLRAVRQLAVEVLSMKRKVAQEKKAYLLELMPDAGLGYRIRAVDSCSSQKTKEPTEPVQFISMEETQRLQLSFLPSEQAQRMGIERVMSTICYDPIDGFYRSEKENVFGMVVGPVKDLAEGRSDRLGTVIFEGDSAEISFD